jgi:hypothetical protein
MQTGDNWKKWSFKFLGEGFLIVMSILLALFIDSYKKSLDDRETELYFLQNLKKDLVSDTLRYTDRKLDLDTVMNYCDSIVTTVKDNSIIKKSLVDKFDILFMSIVGIDFEHDPTFESIKYSSQLGLIKNYELQRELIRYYSYGEFANKIANNELQRITQARRETRNSSGLRLDFNITKEQAIELLKKSEVYNLTFDSMQTINFVIQILDYRINDSKNLITDIDRYLNEGR